MVDWKREDSARVIVLSGPNTPTDGQSTVQPTTSSSPSLGPDNTHLAGFDKKRSRSVGFMEGKDSIRL